MPTQDAKNSKAIALSDQAIALAEHLGRLAGTVEGTAEQWFNQSSLTEQLTRVRDGAEKLLQSLAGGAAKGRRKGKAAAGKGARPVRAAVDRVHAPGKKHRTPGPTLHGVKKSDQRIPKAKASEAARRRRKSYA